MKHWTKQAENRLEEYCRARAAREGMSAAEADDLREDLRMHVHEEAGRLAGEAVGLAQLDEVLARLDGGAAAEPSPVPPRPPEPSCATGFPARAGRMAAGFLMWSCGVVLPAAVLVFEMASSFCASVFFSPVPTWGHAAWLAAVPLLHTWLLRGGGYPRHGLRGAAAGFALVPALFYGLLFLPLLHLSLIALIAYGLGLLSLTPPLAALASMLLTKRARSQAAAEAAEPRFRKGWCGGLIAGLSILCVLEGPGLWTRLHLERALHASHEPARQSAVERLRFWHSENALLKACYEGNRGTQIGTDMAGWVAGGWMLPLGVFGGGRIQEQDSEAARDLFFRVTGKPFNSLKPPAGSRGGMLIGRADPFEEIEFDQHLGGDDVAVRIRHLDLAQSRFDGHLDTASQLGYGEWTMVFRNGSGLEKEARCQVRLPRGGHVSRLTLWVNGEPREAAFHTVAKVKEAYRSIAVVQRKDPVLVHVSGPDTVMVQCFPVPARGEMKIRLGITAPLSSGAWEMPHLLERNFGLAGNLQPSIWFQADQAFRWQSNGSTTSSSAEGQGHALTLTLPAEDLLRQGLHIQPEALPAEPAAVWCQDPFASPENRYLIRKATACREAPAANPILVVDGSAAMAAAADWLARSAAAEADHLTAILLADDGFRRIQAKDLRHHRFRGGRDNGPALREALRLARQTNAPILWIHGPQSIGLSGSEALLQSIERSAKRPRILQIEAVPGPNRLATELFRSGCLERGPALADPARDFPRFLTALRSGRETQAILWQRQPEDHPPENGTRVWDQLARHWAALQAEDASSTASEIERATLAATYHMVTRFSGAVVLETMEQFAQHGLSPVDASAAPAIPSVPEPSSSLLLLLGLMAALCRRKR